MAAAPPPPTAIQVLERSRKRGRLPHSLLLHGPELNPLEELAASLARDLLACHEADPAGHPDFFRLAPANKMRLISADHTRALIHDIQHTPQAGPRKVAVVLEADRFHETAANIFLKTLEEPPLDTTILLLTTRPHSLLPTIRSRCVHLRIPSPSASWDEPEVQAWMTDFEDWLARLADGRAAADRNAVATHIFRLYGLVTRFNGFLTEAVDREIKAGRKDLPESLDSAAIDAWEAGTAVALRQRFFREVEQMLCRFARRGLREPGADSAPLTASIAHLERVVALLRANFRPEVALESFLLACLRLWVRR
ncbi:MAG: DNA polymerase III subunit gamma/tau [Puniceicoccaceae bacterium]|nr:MAG: DNA polymerase III subunit gamma/tau [Puniceicoccaceae bacterium]